MANKLVGEAAIAAILENYSYVVSDAITESYNDAIKCIRETSGAIISRGEKKIADKIDDITEPGIYAVKILPSKLSSVSSEMFQVNSGILKVSSPAEGYIHHEFYPYLSADFTNDTSKKQLRVPIWRIKYKDNWGLWHDYAGNAYEITLNDPGTELPGPIEDTDNPPC